MKKLLLILLLFLMLASLFGIKTGKSIFYADSYMLRARGVEAAYWNPANIIPSKYIDIWLPGINTGIQVNNNSLDLDTYNYIMSSEYLNEADKQTILDEIDGSLRGAFSGNSSIGGFTLANMSFSSSVSYMGRAAISERYLELLLYGNTDTLYVFDKGQNNLSTLSYADLTFGMGDLKLPFLPKPIPAVRAGFSGSILVGIGSMHTERYDGYLQSSSDGITLHQDIVLRSGAGGIGFKSMFGLASTPMPGLDVGLTLDNIFGFINWSLVSEDLNYHFAADSVFIANINDDFYTQTNERVDTDAFSIELPPELRLAAMYTHQQLSVSADYVQAFKNSISTDKTGRLALGAQLIPVPFLRLNWGLGLGNSQYPWRVSYGISAHSSTAEFGLSVQSFEAFFPGNKSKGIAFGSFVRLWI